MLKTIFRQGQVGKNATTEVATSLLHVLADSFSAEERRHAAIELTNALSEDPSTRSSISSYALEIICNTIRSDWKDDVILRNCLESLAILVDFSTNQVCECNEITPWTFLSLNFIDIAG